MNRSPIGCQKKYYIHLVKRSNDQTLKEALATMLRDFHLEEKVNEGRLRERWEGMFGKTIAKYTRKIAVKNKKLYLTIDSSSLKQELLFNKQKMMDRINLEIAAEMVHDIILM